MTPIGKTSPESVIAGSDPQIAIRRCEASQSPALHGYMLGRGILANPFLAEEIKAATIDPLCVIARRNRACHERSVVEAIQDNGLDCRASLTMTKIERLHNYVIDLYEDRLRHAGGSPKVLGRMKELWSYLMYSFEEPQVVWRKIKKINALKEYEEAVEYIFMNNRIKGI